MLLELGVLIVACLPPALNTVVKNFENVCRIDEFRCGDGACVSLSLVCDGESACADGSDEVACAVSYKGLPFLLGGVPRRRRQVPRCTGGRWRCRDGSCIDSDGKCDGIQNCADGSDETHALCRNTNCPDHLFRCTYGACVDGYGKCDKEKNCVDNSDELHPDCFPGNKTIVNGQFICADGSKISSTAACDGKADCPDGSDETVRACGATRCHAIHFQCAYGACVDTGSDCDGRQDCADGSDEANELCNRQGTGAFTPAPTQAPPPTQAPSGDCVLPPYPDHGRYTVEGNPLARPGQSLQAAVLNVSCDPGYRPSTPDNPFCLGKYWSGAVPSCIRFCQLNPHRSVSYACVAPGTHGGTRACPKWVPSGTQVIPTCNINYYSRPLQYMNCRDGMWDTIEICEPECGRITPDGDAYVIDGWPAQRGEFPWHVGIYRKDITPYKQICGGSIVSTTLVISAAHCFYTDAQKLLAASLFAVAAGKIYRPWNNAMEEAQKTDVSDIKIKERFRGSSTNYQEDIALVFVSTPFEYKTYVRPVCLDFDYIFNDFQLSEGKVGRVAGWGLTKEEGEASQILLTVNLPFIPPGKCIDQSPPGFQEFITGDKFCAGYTNGTSLCKGDSGGGLVFPSTERSITRYYLRGIVSTGPRNLEFKSCESHFYTTFTEVTKHEMFIRPYYNRS